MERIPSVVAVVDARFLYLPGYVVLLMYHCGTETQGEVYLIPTYLRQGFKSISCS